MINVGGKNVNKQVSEIKTDIAYFHPEDYAVGGVTDERAFQALINHLISIGGGIVKLRKNTNYTLNNPVYLINGAYIKILGDQTSQIIVNYIGGGGIGSVFDLSNCHDITFEGFTIDGNRMNLSNYNAGTDTNPQATSLISIKIKNDSKNIDINRMNMINPSMDNVYIGQNTHVVHNINIHDSVFKNSGRSHVVITSGSKITIERNYMEKTKGEYIDLEGNTVADYIENVTIENNTMQAITGCIGSAVNCDSPAIAKDIRVTNNTSNIYGQFIVGSYTDGIIVHGNTISIDCSTRTYDDQDGIFVQFLADTTNLKITDNIVNIASDSVEIAKIIKLKSVKDVHIERNEMNINGYLVGIDVSQVGGGITCERINIKNNKINRARGNIILLNNCAESEISNNYLVSGMVAADVTGTDTVRINSCPRSRIAGNKIRLNDVGYTLTSNTIYAFQSDSCLIERNDINFGLGILVYQSNKCHVNKNEVQSGSILLRQNSSTEVGYNYVTGATANAGIYCYADALDFLIIGNHVYNCVSKYGVQIASGSQNGKIINNTLSDNQGTKTQTGGVTIGSTSSVLVISGNDLRGNLTTTINGTCTTYVPHVGTNTFAQDMAAFNLTV